MTRAVLASLAVAVAFLSVAAQEAGRGSRPAGLSVVSPQALAFVHVRVADVWHGELGQAVRRKMPRQTGDLVARLEKEWGVVPADMESVTFLIAGESAVAPPPPGPPLKKEDKAKPR